MLDMLDFAHPVLMITIVLVLLILLWTVSVLQMRLRVAESRLESLERELATMDEQMSFLAQISQRKEAPSAPPLDGSLSGLESLDRITDTPEAQL